MGLVLDSGVLIAAERAKRPVSDLIAAIKSQTGRTKIVISTISVVELEHALHRAQTPEQAQRRRAYLDSVFGVIPAEPFIIEMARIAGKLDADGRKAGRVIPFSDLLIGATALHFEYAVGTGNLCHFEMIPDLSIVEL
jgi:predicted nucleic acid-binding protein